MNVIETDLPGVLIIEPKVFGDDRGFFMETWNKELYAEAGIPTEFVQDNLSFSSRGVLRGLHFQDPNPQGKIVSVLQGEVYDVVVDIRYRSPTFGKWTGVTLSSENKRQLYIPEGFAHGFCVTHKSALFSYKCTQQYNPKAERVLTWNDSTVSVDWPVTVPLLSGKDQKGLSLEDIHIQFTKER
ncbi:MAG: dTDP-4-dehydrorhamnose 3,5-epimerase [Paraglaciecola sp.]|jgi:dTDP-4-dehydrorhamnose 3,5-epimerase